MKSIICICLILVAISVASHADIGFEVQVGQSYTGNLLLDSSNFQDSYYNTNVNLHYYPFPIAEISLKSEYTYYGELIGLGNIRSGAGITLIPTRAESPASFYISANWEKLDYRQEFDVYNTNDIDILSSLGYRLGDKVQLRAGISYKNTKYINSDVADKESYEFFAGGNFTLFGSNSLDLEGGYSYAKSRFIDEASLNIFPVEPKEEPGNLKSFYISPRFSRPLGGKTGMSISFAYAQFLGDYDPVVYSYATGFLSPWASVWEGNSITLKLKSYLIPKTIINAGAGYWNKNFLRMFEFPDRVKTREDDLSRYYISFSWPVPSRSGMFFEPTLQIEFSNCTSSHRLYDYSNFSVTLGATIRK